MSFPPDILLQKLRSGDDEAYREVHAAFFPILIATAHRIVRDDDDARDVVQTVFINIFQRRDYLDIRDLKYYLIRAVRNESLNLLRTRNRLQAHHQQYAETVGDVVINDLLEQAEHEERIYRAILRLPDQCRRVFTMSRIDDRSNAEIAQELGISIRTVETHISNALRWLRRGF